MSRQNAARVGYDPLAPATLADPYPVYARLRTQAPVFWHAGMGCWVLSRYADCVAVLRDHQGFARDWRRVGEAVPEASLSVQSLDPPALAAVRGAFLRALHAQDLGAISGAAAGLLEVVFDRLADRGCFDLVAEVAQPLALQVICDLLGVAAPEVESFAAVSDAIMRGMDAGLDPARAEPARRARAELTALVASWFTETGGPGLLADVRTAPDVPPAVVQNTARVMFQGGYSTMVAAIGNIAAVLLRHPGVLEEVRARPDLAPAAVEELVRFDGPVQGTSRAATAQTVIGGRPIGAGQTVLTLYAAANHDPDVFNRPDELRLDRAPNPHLGFGWGPHACLGTLLAQTGLTVLLTALAARPPLRPCGPARRDETATMRRLAVLPVTFRRSTLGGSR
ncbi:cytochrome P450 [Actinomadura viridis]|uniref:cytochrome P450 n=1 Tax=Actinomadura viridis TaxID=58110 RepID=UPI0036973C8D